MPQSGADLIVDALADAGVSHIFSLSGNQILPVYDALIGRDFRLIHTRHEAAAVHMADAWGRLTEQPGIALVPAGSGHGNTIGALYVAQMAESPVVLLSGHCPAVQVGHGAFQETDQAATAAPVTKVSWQVAHPEQIPSDITAALAIATTGRPGPVHLS
ncbi:MAG: thiamine pyrophosphate-binding protein, partial [Candidatus Latescibacteria bacterium]|nr:thiamine pyrophosphate-binding protein [Candidatus Latescibacterota bacterium]